MKIPQYITGLTREDLAEIARTTNLTVGRGIKIDRSGDAVTIAIDESEFKRMVYAFNANGGFSASYDALDDIPLE